MRKNICRLSLICALTYVFLCMSGCGLKNTDSGAYEAALEAMAAKDYETAVSELEYAIKYDNCAAQSYRQLGIIYLRQGDYEAAISMLDTALSEMNYKNEEFQNDVLLYKAEALFKSELETEALEIYEQIKGTAAAGYVYAYEGCEYLANKEYEAAAESFELVFENGDDIGLALMIYEAYSAVNLEGYGAAYLERAANTEPQTAYDYACLGQVYNYLNDYNNACIALGTAVEMGYTEAIDILGNIYIEAGDISGARALYLSVISDTVDISAGYNGLAMCSIAEEDYEGALVYIELGLKDQNSDSEQSLLFNQVVVYEGLLDFETALEKAREYLEKYPDDEVMLNEYRFLLHS